MKRLLLLVTLSLLQLSTSFSQTCDVKGVEDWEKVDVRLMTVKEEKVKGYKLVGEGKMDVSPQVMSFEDLSTDELTEIKKYVAKFKGCIAFVDIEGFYESDMFPIRAVNKVYFYWFVPN